MNLFLHLGMPKTGSKALQQFLMLNNKELMAQGFLFPSTYRESNWHRSLFEVESDFAMEALSKEARNVENIIFSYEAGYTASNRIISNFNIFSKIEIIIFIREPWQWTNSFLNQLFKSHKIPYSTIKNFSTNMEEIQNYLGIDKHIKRWESNCNNLTVSFKNYNFDLDIIDAFLNWANINKNNMKSCNYSDVINPNPAADLTSLAILLEIKKRLKNSSIDRLSRTIQVAHLYLKDRWIDTKKNSPPILLSKSEIIELQSIYLPTFNQLLANNHESEFASYIFSDLPNDFNRDSILKLKTSHESDLVDLIINKAECR